MELKLFIGENRNNGDKGAQGAGENIYFGTVVPDHIGDNYAFIHSCAIIGGKLVLGMDKQPTNIDITKVTIGGIDTAVTWDGGKNEFTGTPNQKLIDMFSMVGGNTDSIGEPTAPPAVLPPLIPSTSFDITLGEDTSKLIRGYKDPASTVGGFGSIDTTAFGPSTLFAIEFRHDVVDPANEFDEIEVILKDANASITEINIVVEGEVITLADGNSNNKTFYQHSKADARIATIYAAIMAKTLGSHVAVKLSAV